MANPTVADYLLHRLRTWGVDHVFGYPGDGINGILAAWTRTGNDPVFVQSRHEEMSAFEAVGYAKFTGRPGVCMATSGPGAIHLLNGLYDAKLDHVPVVAIVGQTDRSAMGGSYQQEVDLHTLYKDVASAFVETVTVPEQLPNVLDRAMRTAIAYRTPTAVIIHGDVQELEYSPPGHEFKMVPSSVGFDRPRIAPDDDAIRRAAEILNAGDKVAMLVGSGARDARAQLEQVADLLGAGVAKALLGKDVLSDELPWVTGSIGLLGTRPTHEMMTGCDTLLIVGSSLPYSQFLPEYGQARCVQIDIDPNMIGMRYPNEVNLVADAAAALDALVPLLQRKADRSWREGIEQNVQRWWQTMGQQAEVETEFVNPLRMFAEASPRLPDDAIVTADSGSAANWYARQLQFRGDMRGSLSGTLATMGPAVPYGIGAKFANPGRPVVAFAGDGAMQMNGMAELITIQRYWQQWADPRLVVAIIHNNDLNQVTWEMRAMGGAPKFAESQSLPDVDYAAFARSLGLGGETVKSSDEMGSAWDRALAADRPTVLDVYTDPDMPPIPPHATWEQFTDVAKAVLAGDENRWGFVKQGVKTKLQEYLPGNDR
ncbi:MULTISPECIES: thiamine pyrophosphate-requiring protein [Rhodococcus]|uniref:Thiamine pyrophosphate-requiring protein n=1 Tax=Rhodococcus rhodochrous TaxID=1829 RepID=A0AAW4XGE7_RHORH|nr:MULTISPECIES: thiamine pyrophosphate-requiring protein [Rhodococcus]KLL97177.1 thiamine pyrophosphate-binding protein [Rhodococcus sp. IITR03]MCD2111971.1 thiamine pyrophosphate-requiring protein [Rhodococcus rhodochrous]QHG84484.1 thiamine pyrophosphate-requiring protein [Rhodococcus rhodochrous]QOH55779.1 thiamine pyrophosphate-requiring protein [Rhodococcus rhodochrous]WAL47817.1 thiamine pyrophosphate-requiring protein [Rhodococcus pyridinivorans]